MFIVVPVVAVKLSRIFIFDVHRSSLIIHYLAFSSNLLVQFTMPAKPKTLATVDSQQPPVVGRLLGGVVIAGFIITWVSSLISPFLLIAALTHGYYLTAATISTITAAAYFPWKPGVVSQLMKDFINKYHPQYYNSCRVEFEEEIPSPPEPSSGKQPRQPTLYAVHPHGAFSLGWALLFAAPTMYHVRFCFAPFLFISPFFRLFSRCAGKPGSAGKADMKRYMKRGEDIALPPGGFEEATISSLHHDRVFIKKRTGFIRLCLQHGYAVRPVYVFGERSLFWNLQGAFKFRMGMNRYALPAVVVWGQPFFPLLPKHAVDVRVVTGAPLLLPKIEKPTKQDVDLWHGKYMAALTKLFEDHKEDAFGSEFAKTAKLELW
jgi:hypothetical protein